jgi:hypothetical protein
LGLDLGTGSGVFRAAQAFEEIVLQAQKPGELKGKAPPSAFSASHSWRPQPPW